MQELQQPAIIGLAETWLSQDSPPTTKHIPHGYTFVGHHPHHLAHQHPHRQRSGGVGFLVCSYICCQLHQGPGHAPHIFTAHNTQHILCIRLKQPNNNSPPLSLVCCYLPPPSSSSVVEDFLDDFSALISDIPAGDRVLVVGGFNIRTGSLTEASTLHNTDPDPLHPTPPLLPIHSTPRTSMDTTTTAGHHQLLNSLRDLRLALLNGRTTPELSCAFTNTIMLGQSTIDYAITNSSCATSIKSRMVCSGLGRLASQLYAGGCYGALGHTPLLLELSLCLPTTATPAGTSHGPVFRWRSLPTWVDHLASPHFQQQLATLSATLDRPGLCLTTFVDQFTTLLRHEAHKVFPKPSSPHPSSRHKPWFDHECRQAHRAIKQALREGAPPPALQQARRVFKSLVRRKKNMHTITHIEKLIKL